MKAVYSFWSTRGDILKESRHYIDIETCLYSWIISTNKAKEQFGKVELITDSISAKSFELMNLPIDKISTELDSLSKYNKELWSLGKIKAYQMQDEPFIHIDEDVFLFKPLPEDLLKFQILFQSFEPLNIYISSKFYNFYNWQIQSLKRFGVITESFGLTDYAVNCGIYLCNNLEYNQEYCKESFELVDKNLNFWKKNKRTQHYCVIFEQYIAACVARRLNIPINVLSQNYDDIDNFKRLGYVHLWGQKKSQHIKESVKKRVEKDYPQYIELVEKLLKDNSL